jgi:DNA-binding response OmpR family regulator
MTAPSRPEAKTHILVVDDEPAITASLAAFLRRAGYTVTVAANGEEALRRVADSHPGLIILDVIMPQVDGREVCRQLRAAGNWTPIIMLTQVGDSTEIAMSLEEGADDYLSKPFDPQVLAARIKAVLRRARPGAPPLTAARRIACGDIVLDRSAQRVLLANHELALSHLAVRLLDYLMTHPGEVLSRDRLLDAIWGYDYPVGTRAVDMRIAELRKLLGDDADSPRYIQTMTGEGYIFIARVEALP